MKLYVVLVIAQMHFRQFTCLLFCSELSWAQDIPTAFWRAHGQSEFDGCWYTLHGPKLSCSVKTATNTYGKQTICSFTKGWRRFCTTNEMKLGDTVIFRKIGQREFEARKV